MRTPAKTPSRKDNVMKITLDRNEVRKLLIATTACSSESEYWQKLHDKIKAQLDEWDEKHQPA